MMSGDEAAGEDKDVAMLNGNDTPEKNDTQEEEPKECPPVAKPAAAEQQQPVIHAAGSKELRLQQQDDDEEEEVAVQAVVADDDDEEDDDGDAVMASVVVDDEEVPVAEVATTDTTAAPAKKPSSKATKSKPAKKGRKSQVISQDRLAAALKARRMLSDTVPRLPVAVRDTHVVRSFGRIRVETPTSEESKFSSANALYPVGFSCDRYEFSPVHGRVLKMRCTIFDGAKLKEKQRQSWQTVSEDIPDGPIFRVMWGQGVDEDVDIVDYPYDLYSASAPISNDGKVDTAVSISAKDEAFEPEEGMRVRVRFDNNMWYAGTILSVAIDDAFYDHSKKKIVYDIRIHYDDGSIEDTHFPDPDVSIFLPSAEDASMENGIIEIDQLRGKPVTSVIGNSPLEAWGNALIKLGLIDEIMLQSALEARAAAQVEGRAEAEERFGIKKVNRQAPAQKHQKQEETAAADEKDVDSSSKKEPATTEETQEGEATTQEPDGEKSEQQAPSSSGPALPKLDAPTDNDEPRAENGSGENSTASSNDHPATDCTKKDDTADTKAVSPVPPSGRDHEVNGRKDMQDDKDAQHDRATDESKDDEKEEAKEAEPSSQAETELRRQVEKLQQELAHLQAEDREASIALANARISTMGPFLINPFHERGPALTQELQWLTTVIRKEKTKMGSTGNKKKVVSSTDLLERNDTFFNGDIEALVEGLPGSEFCPSYVFQAFRAGGASAVSQAWVHEAKLRQEREREKQAMSASKAKADASQLREKERKRKRREDERDARKRQKEGEMDEKKRARAEERMARLNVQVDERLFKEACFQREKVVLLLAKSLGKDFSMRRKAAELVSGQSILDGLTKKKNVAGDSGTQEIPSLGRVYDEDVLRVWDFFTTFGSTFLERGYLPTIPTLDSLQDAIDCLRDEKEYRKTRPEAIDQLVQIAMALCHPLAATLTRYLFASLIALNPALQKDFGAAFFNEVNATATAKDGSENAASKSVLPMNEMTWQEVARLTFLSDSMGEIGYSRQDSAHLLRGYRSGGHPNSKESKRLRRCEDNSVALLRQELSQRESNKALESLEESSTDYKIRVNVPTRPSASRDEWIFYLHNLKSLPQDAVKPMKENIRKAIALLEAADPKPADAKAALSDLHRGLTIIEGVKASEEELSHTDTQSCKKVRRIFLRVLDRASGEVFSSNVIGSVVHKDDDVMSGASESKTMGSSIATVSSDRQRMGLLNSLTLSDKEFKKYTQSREEYMAEALRLKEEMNGAEEGEEEEDDDDDDEDDADGDKKMPAVETEKPKEDGKTGASVVENGDGSVNNASPAALGSTEKNAKSEGEKPASAEIVATVVENGDTKAENDATAVPEKPDNASPFDEFCGDIPGAPELIRRCLAVLRTLCRTESAEPFLYPVDPQSNPGYYEVILKPMCFREVGMRLRDAASLYVRQSPGVDAVANDDMQREVVASIVAQFAGNVRLIAQNSACYGNAGAMVVCAGEEMIRIFERLFLDWVLAPEDHRRPLELLDDDKCVDFHPSDDDDGTVLLCDSCEGKFSMSRLDPPLLKIPKGDWYCPRCVSGRSWGSLDPRIGKSVKAKRSRK